MYQLTEEMEGLNEGFKSLGFKQNYYKSFIRMLSWIFVYLIVIFVLHIVSTYSLYANDSPIKHSTLCAAIINWPVYTTTVVDLGFIFTLQYVCLNF